MSRRYYSDDDSFDRIISATLLLYFLYLIGNYFTNRANFWKWLIYGLLVTIGFIAAKLGWNRFKYKRREKKVDELFLSIRRFGLEEYIQNFINRFGLEGRAYNRWRFRNYSFDWHRLDDFRKFLYDKGVNISLDNWNDTLFLLRAFIQNKEERLTRESINKEPQKLASLTGADFEKLVYRLFETIGYSVELVGRSGDQGGDLIANKNGERLLIQTKCYRDWSTGNEAVQQVVAAMKYYDCKKAIVITTSYFTPEAIALAKANSVELIPKKRLQEMLLKYLNESWS